MKRTKKSSNRLVLTVPDAINCSGSIHYTQIPNQFLRNNLISGKAKAILGILLSNKEGWRTHVTTLQSYMKEGRDAIRSGIQELEKFEYVTLVRYRRKSDKKWAGIFWAYTDKPGIFNIEHNLSFLEENGLEIYGLQANKPQTGLPYTGLPYTENPTLKRLSNKKTKKHKKIILADFDKFMKQYPPNRIGSKGACLKRWQTLCNMKDSNSLKPTWIQIKEAIDEQKLSSQWKEGEEWIPLATTWLNQNRWLDDPKQLKKWEDRKNGKVPKNAFKNKKESEYSF